MGYLVSWLLIGLFALKAAVLAQTYTDCNPLNATCPEDVGLANYTFTTDFTAGANTNWIAADGTTITYSDLGAAFTITEEGEAPLIHTDFYMFFGYVEVKMRAANGTGIVSSVVLESDDLDEIDWEWLGGNNTSVETNYFGKGNTTAYDRAIYYDVTTPTTTFHTYGIEWTSASIVWSIDGTVVRTLPYASALNGANFPQTPCRVNLGVWAAGASDAEGTVTWAGGKTDFDDAPFIMYVESVKIINYNPAVNYNYTDFSGTYDSIAVVNTTVSSNSSTATGGVSANLATASVSSNSSSSTATTATTKTTGTSGGSTTTSTSTATNTGFSQNSSVAGKGADDAWVKGGLLMLLCFTLGFVVL